MEENSDVHMETDVTSTTDDAVDTQEVTGSNGQVEMTITVEKVDEENDSSNMENDSQIKSSSFVSSGSTAKESPQKEMQSQSIAQKSLNKSNEASEPIQKSPAKTESPQKVTSIISPVKNTVQTTCSELKAESADSSTKADPFTSFSKDKRNSKENNSDSDKDLNKSFHTVKKSPLKETGTEISPIKDSEQQKIRTSFQVLKSPVKEKPVEKSLIKEAAEQKRSFQVIQRSSSIKSPPIKLVRKQSNKESKLHDTNIKEIKLQDTYINEIQSQDPTKPSTSKDVSTLDTTLVNGELTIPKPSQNEILPEPESQPTTSNAAVPMDILELEASNDSQLSSTASEKEHNKSISRELKSLINSAKESKIISECTQLTSKTRKSRTNLDVSLNSSVEPEIIQSGRRDSQASETDKTPLKRSMRSQNPDFVTKCKQFLNSVTARVMKDSDETQSEGEPEDSKQKQKLSLRIEQTDSSETTPKKKKVEEAVVEITSRSNKLRSDPYCWRCHWQLEAEPNEKPPVHPSMHCTICVRSYHFKCMTVVERKPIPEKNWVCPDCLQILHAESSETRSPAMKKISLGMLCDLLKFALERMEAINGVEPFLQPVDRSEFPDYDKTVVHPMDLSQMRRNITDGHYGSTEAFIADAQWILHNSILFNASHSKLTLAARALVRTCRAEMAEIETCPECYAGAHSRNLTYFTDVCSTPHMILWAKLKGFPYWPAKAVAVNNGMVDVRFFGQHDKSWVPVRDCFLYSEKDPNTTKYKKQELMQCRQEAEVHIRNICRKYGTFVYAPFKTTFDHSKINEQLKMMIPSFDGEIKTINDKKASPVTKDKRSISKSSKNSSNDGDISECDEASTKSSLSSQQTTDDDHTGTTEQPNHEQEPNSSINEKENTMEIDVSRTTEPVTPSRKRRRSTFPEPDAVEITAQKMKKVNEKPKEVKPEPGSSNKEDRSAKNCNKSEAVVGEISKKDDTAKEIAKPDKVREEKCKPNSTAEKEVLKVTPIKLVALPRLNKQIPKIFTTAKVTSTPDTPTTSGTPVEEKSLTSSSKRSKVSKADRFIITEQKDLKDSSSRRNSRNNKSLTSTPKQEKDETRKSLDKSSIKSSDKNSDSGSDPSVNKEKTAKKKDNSERSLLKKTTDSPKTVKDEKAQNKKSEDDRTLNIIARENLISSSGLPTISNIVSLSTTVEKTSTTTAKTNAPNPKIAASNTKITVTNTKTTAQSAKTTTPSTKTTAPSAKTTTPRAKTTAPKTIEITVEANPDSRIFTPTSTSNVGNIREAVSKLQMLRNETSESLVGRVGVKAFARMTSPDVNDDVQVEVKTEPIDIDEIDEERQIEKMDLMNACKLQPVSQTQSLRDVRINKVVVTPVVAKKPGGKAPEPRPRAKKTFPQPRRPEAGSELNGKNSMVYIPIQPPNTQPPIKPVKPGSTQHGITMPMCVTAGPKFSAPVVSSNVVNTVTTPLRPITSTLSSPPPLIVTPTSIVCSASATLGQVSNLGQLSSGNQVSNVNQVPTVGPTTVHTVPLMTSVNGQWMLSLQPVMSVGGIDSASSSPMLNGIVERPGTTLLPISASNAAPNATVLPSIAPVTSRSQLSNASPVVNDNGTPEMPRLLQRPLLSPFDANTPIGSLPPPSTAGPLTAKLNQNAVKLTDFFRTLLEDSIDKLDEPLAQITALKIQLEQARWRHQQNLDEIKHNHELTLSEMRQLFEKEKQRIISEARRAAQVELEAAVKLTKSKQWCSNCQQEAQFYCCWNTSYCDYSCQRAHWNSHFSHCTQEQSFRQLLLQNRQEQREKPPDRNQAQGDSKVATVITHFVGPDAVTQQSLPSTTPKEIPEPSQLRHQVLTVQKTLPSSTHIHILEQEPRLAELRAMFSSATKNKVEQTEQRSREQQVHKNIELGVQRLRDQQLLNISRRKKNLAQTEQHSVEQQTILQSPSDMEILEPTQPRLREQPREENVTLNVQREKLQIILDNAKQRDELRRQQMLLDQSKLGKDERLLDQTANSTDKGASEPRVHLGDNPPKSIPPQTPGLTTVGGKPAPMRVFTDPSGTQKTSIIGPQMALVSVTGLSASAEGAQPVKVRMGQLAQGQHLVSMIEDPSGNQTLKCVGTYKAPAPATTQISPLLINKQTNDDSGAAKKTVTSGGYLIVGASGNTTSVITPATAARRSHNIQYFS